MDNKKIYGRMRHIGREMDRRNSVNLSAIGLSGAQLQAMIFIHVSSFHGNDVCQRDIERELNLRPSSVSTLIQNLEKQGYVTRTLSNGDARQKVVVLTKAGEDLCMLNKQIMDSNDVLVQDALTDEEQDVLVTLLDKILDSIKSNNEHS